MCGKFSHFQEDDIAEFQKMVNERYDMIKSLVEVTAKKADEYVNICWEMSSL